MLFYLLLLFLFWGILFKKKSMLLTLRFVRVGFYFIVPCFYVPDIGGIFASSKRKSERRGSMPLIITKWWIHRKWGGGGLPCCWPSYCSLYAFYLKKRIRNKQWKNRNDQLSSELKHKNEWQTKKKLFAGRKMIQWLLKTIKITEEWGTK